MSEMFKRGIRGGITQAVHRYVKANNKYMGDKFNPKEESSFLPYLNADNLYGWAMIQLLQTGRFSGFDHDDVSKFTSDETGRLAKDSSKGYQLEVDVKYPK